MTCRFEREQCPMPGNYSCQKCQTCGHMISVPAEIPETAVLAAIEGIKSNCPHNQKVVDGIVENSHSATTDPTAALPSPFEGPQPPMGPGAYLKKYLSRIGITATPNCSCNAKARRMDDMGIEWCEENLVTIVGWLKEEAERRHLPFFEWPAKMLVQKAIKSAKRARDESIAGLSQPQK